MSVVVFLGPPGVGKGTQAGFIRERLGAIHVSTGALLREEIDSNSALGNEVKDVIARGDLVNDEQLFLCLESKLDRIPNLSSALLLLDGVPRTRQQVARLDQILKKYHVSVELVLSLFAPLEKLVDRFARRWSCKSCGNIFSLPSPPMLGVVCVKCGQLDSLVRRKDDEPEAVRYRFSIFESETAPLVADYEKRGLVTQVNGLGDPEGVFGDLKAEIVKLF